MARLQSGSSSANKPPSKPNPHLHPQSQPQNTLQNPQVARHRTRHRSYSDPFSDPVHQAKPVPRLPPEPPPKYPPHPKMASTNKQSPHRDNIVEAVRDTVLVRSEQPSRIRTGRSQTVVTNQPAGALRTHGRRSMSQDSVLHAANVLEKAKAKPRGKKGSVHADVIDRLDFSGVGPMFHHDGPFDAFHQAKPPFPPVTLPYPSPDAYKGAFSPTYDIPKKKVDAIAEAWGIHEPEPYEEFFAGGGTARRDGDTPSNSIYAGREGHGSRNGTPQHSIGRRSKDGRDLREVYREYLDEDVRQPQARDRDLGPDPPQEYPKRTKSLMQRIRKMRDSPNVPVGYDEAVEPTSPTSADQYQSAGRPTHRSQNSFLGRFAGGNGTSTDRRGNLKENMSPLSDNSESYVYIDDPRREKQLPATPYAPATARTPSGEERYADYDGTPGSPGAWPWSKDEFVEEG
ncbi:hypothetical protein J3R83DRAFT_6512 [Lanmaoa asiatica]|nr:hypothetical protein J3R83DRAFT_6512 [Lanmaoa asiatica]